MPTVGVYVKADDARMLEAEGEDVATWVREMIEALLKRKRERDNAEG